MARVTGLEPATSGVTGRHSNRLSYTRTFFKRTFRENPWETSWPGDLDRSVGGFLRGSRTGVKRVSRQNNDAFPLSTVTSIFCGVSTKNSKKHHEGSCGFFAIRIDQRHRRGGQDPVSRRAISSVGRAPRLHRGCREFESLIAHHFPSLNIALTQTEQSRGTMGDCVNRKPQAYRARLRG
jgi:hypothetical protein